MASSQYKAGHLEAARRILIGARAGALKNHFRDSLIYTLSNVVSGLAELGFYDAAKADIRRFSETDRLQVYLNVAFIQGKRNDLEAARKTFQEAIQREVRKKGPHTDERLYEIGMAQARMGLLDEARKTASLIGNPSLRQMVETSIREQSAKPE